MVLPRPRRRKRATSGSIEMGRSRQRGRTTCSIWLPTTPETPRRIVSTSGSSGMRAFKHVDLRLSKAWLAFAPAKAGPSQERKATKSFLLLAAGHLLPQLEQFGLRCSDLPSQIAHFQAVSVERGLHFGEALCEVSDIRWNGVEPAAMRTTVAAMPGWFPWAERLLILRIAALRALHGETLAVGCSLSAKNVIRISPVADAGNTRKSALIRPRHG